MPPVPVPKAVIMVSCVTPRPKTTCPTANVPLDTESTVKVVPEIEPVKTAVAGVEMRHV